MPFLPPNQQRQSTEGSSSSKQLLNGICSYRSWCVCVRVRVRVRVRVCVFSMQDAFATFRLR